MKATKKLALVCAALAAAAFGFVSCSSDDDSDYDDNVKLVVLARQPTSWNGASSTSVTTLGSTTTKSSSTYGTSNGVTTSSVIEFAFNGTFTQTDLNKTDDKNYTKTVTTGTFSGFPALSNQNITFNISKITVTSVVAGVSTVKTYSSVADQAKQQYLEFIKSFVGSSYDESKVTYTLEGASQTITGRTDGNKQLTVTDTSVGGKLTVKYDTTYLTTDSNGNDGAETQSDTTTTTVYNKQ